MPLIPAPPDTFALMVRSLADDTNLHEWFVESVVAFDAEDGGAYIVGGLNRGGALVRLDDVATESGFEVKIWQQVPGSKDEAYEWARGHVKVVYDNAAPLDLNDPRWFG